MDANGLQEFCGELASVYDLNHQNLLKPQHVDTWENMPYLIMAYCAQGSCAGKLGKMTETQMWKFIRDVASGLAYLHEKDVVHQDIKPDNILIDDAGNYLITDFGVSTRARSTLRKSVVSSTAGGTTAYMGPERFSRQPAPTKASDLWSFGAMCFELLEGVVPFGEIGGGMQKGGAEIPVIQANVSDALKYTVTKMLQKETWDRPTAATLVEWANHPQNIEIDHSLLEDGSAPAAPASPTPDVPSQSTRRFNTPPVVVPQDTPRVAPEMPKHPGSKVQQMSKEGSSKMNKNIIIALLCTFIIIVVVIIIGAISADNEAKRALIYNHDVAVSQFEIQIENADINNIETLEHALDNLQTIKRYENNPKFEGKKVYSNKKSILRDKTQHIYEEAERKYRKAPAGTDLERKNLEKLNKVKHVKDQI